MNGQAIKFTRSQKILLALFRLSSGTKKQIRFEDIAVEAYRSYKEDFQLRGYPQYPDTGDIIHKPLYSELKKHGYVLSGNKYFSLTPKGIEYARSLYKSSGKKTIKDAVNFDKLTSDQEKELERILLSDAFRLFEQGRKEEILDIDFYSYLSVTVRTNKFDFLGRLSTVEDVISATKIRSDNVYEKLRDCHKYLLDKFKENISFVIRSKGGKR